MVFFKTVAPVEPVSFVQKICEDAMANPMHKRTRTAKRLAPMTLMGKATMEGLEDVAKNVLAPHFHEAPVTPKKVSDDLYIVTGYILEKVTNFSDHSSAYGLICAITTL